LQAHLKAAQAFTQPKLLKELANRQSENEKIQDRHNKELIALAITGRYMQLALRTARIFWLKRTVKWLAVRPAPAPAGVSPLVSRFLPTRE